VKSLACVHDVFMLVASRGQSEESAVLARDMLRWAGRPVARLGLLLGLALAFLELQEAVAGAPKLLGRISGCSARYHGEKEACAGRVRE